MYPHLHDHPFLPEVLGLHTTGERCQFLRFSQEASQDAGLRAGFIAGPERVFYLLGFLAV